MKRASDDTEATAVLARDLALWLSRAGVAPTELAVDFADLLHGAKEVQASLVILLSLDVNRREDAEHAMEQLGLLHAWMFTEMKPHLEEIERGWQQLEDRIVELIPDEE